MTPIRDDAPPSSFEEVREQMRTYLSNYPDFEGLVAAGTLRAVGNGWYELVRGTLPEALGKYMSDMRTLGGKTQFKAVKLTKKLQSLKNSL